jgi:hypothetical protein
MKHLPEKCHHPSLSSKCNRKRILSSCPKVFAGIAPKKHFKHEARENLPKDDLNAR